MVTPSLVCKSCITRGKPLPLRSKLKFVARQDVGNEFPSQAEMDLKHTVERMSNQNRAAVARTNHNDRITIAPQSKANFNSSLRSYLQAPTPTPTASLLIHTSPCVPQHKRPHLPPGNGLDMRSLSRPESRQPPSQLRRPSRKEDWPVVLPVQAHMTLPASTHRLAKAGGQRTTPTRFLTLDPT